MTDDMRDRLRLLADATEAAAVCADVLTREPCEVYEWSLHHWQREIARLSTPGPNERAPRWGAIMGRRRHPPGCPDADWCRNNGVCWWDCQGREGPEL